MKHVMEQIVFPILVVAIGLCSCVGFMLQHSMIHQIGIASAASPLPIPFTDIEGTQHNFAYRYELSVTAVDGSIHTEDLYIKNIVGPHRRIVIYEIAILLWDRSPIVSSKMISHLCQAQPFTKSMIDTKSPKEISISIHDPITDDVISKPRRVVCVS